MSFFRHSQGTDSKVVFAVDYSDTADAIVGKRNGNDTTVNFTNYSLAEVQGKKIGVQGINSFSHLFIFKALEKAGLNEGDVEFVDVPAQNVTRALEKWGNNGWAHIRALYLRSIKKRI